MEITKDHNVRLVRRDVARLVMDEEGKVLIYHCAKNHKKYHANPISVLSFDIDDGPTLESLLSCYPNSVSIQQLPRPPDESNEEKVFLILISNYYFFGGCRFQL